MMKTLRRTILHRYRQAPLGTQLFLHARWHWTPYEAIAARLPDQGTILDLGSGHGLLSMTLALGSERRRVRGIDHDPLRVAVAQRAGRRLSNLHFEIGSLLDAIHDDLSADLTGIVVMDTLHYLSAEEQEAFAARAYALLPPGGVLLVREVDADAGRTFFWNRWHERLMTGLGFTRGERLIFRGRAEWEDLFRKHGFEAASERCGRFPFADVLFACRRPLRAA